MNPHVSTVGAVNSQRETVPFRGELHLNIRSGWRGKYFGYIRVSQIA